jgi:hypothetical protein
MPGMFGGGGDSVDTGGMQSAAMSLNSMGNRQQTQADLLNQMANRAAGFGEHMYDYGLARTEKYADPVLNEFTRIMGFGGSTGGPGGYGNVSPMESSLFQSPTWQTQQSTNQSKQNILRNTKPGAQQTALLAEADNQRSANLGTSAFGQVQNMLTALLSQGDQVWKGAQSAQTGYSQAIGAYGGASSALSGAASAYNASGSQYGSIAQLQAEAQQSGNQMLGGIFSTIGTLAGTVLGGPIGGALGGMIGGGVGNAAADVSRVTNTAQMTGVLP